MASTQRETVKLLCKSIITRLENQKAIAFSPRLRQIVSDEVYSLIGPYIMTEEDIREKVLAKLNANAERLAETEFTESDQFKAAKAIVKKSFGDDELNGLFFQKPMKLIAGSILSYLMRSSNIDEVFETDEDLEKKIVHVIKNFNPSELH